MAPAQGQNSQEADYVANLVDLMNMHLNSKTPVPELLAGWRALVADVKASPAMAALFGTKCLEAALEADDDDKVVALFKRDGVTADMGGIASVATDTQSRDLAGSFLQFVVGLRLGIRCCSPGGRVSIRLGLPKQVLYFGRILS